MYVVSGIPISRGIALDELSYFTIREVAPGDVVKAPVRGVQKPLLVTKVEPVGNMKASLRSQHFELQKLGPDAPTPILFPQLLTALDVASNRTLAHKGALLYTCIPAFVLEDPRELPAHHTSSSQFEHVPLQAQYADRIAQYKNMVRESFARGESVFVLVPTRADVLALSEELSSGIAQYIVPLHGSLSTSVARRRWDKALSEEHPIVIVATPTFLSLPRSDLGTLICERESDTSYTRIERPHVDMTVVAYSYAEALGLRYISGDTILTPSTLYKVETHQIDTPHPLATKVKGGVVETIHYTKPGEATAMTERTARTGAHQAGTALDDRLIARMRELLAAHNRIVVVAPRKGLATTVICRDCGTRALCSACGGPFKLHTKVGAQKKNVERTEEGEHPNTNRVLHCSRCGHSTSADVTCGTCTSWRLTSYGIGDEMLVELFTKEFPGTTISSPNAKKTTVAGATIRVIYAADLWQCEPADCIVFPSLESLLAVPSPDADLAAARQIARAREVAPLALVHTRARELDARLRSIVDGALGEVTRADLALRKALAMPPFVHTVDITVQGSRTTVVRDARVVIDTLRAYKPKPEHEMERTGPTTLAHTTHFTFPHSSNPHAPFPDEFVSLVRSLPPSCIVRVA